MFLPLKDRNPLRTIPFQFVTATLIGLCVAIFLWQLSLARGEDVAAIYGLGMIPAVLTGERELAPELVRVPAELTLVTAMFLHAGWWHLVGNMLYLWVFGDNVEDAMGHLRFLLFYLLSGVAAGLAHILANPGSEVPTIGASGAISGVLGAYLVLHPRARVLVMVFFRLFVYLPAYVVLGSYIVLQFVYVATGTGGNTALWAHIGGFVAGALLVVPLRRRGVPLFDRGGPR